MCCPPPAKSRPKREREWTQPDRHSAQRAIQRRTKSAWEEVAVQEVRRRVRGEGRLASDPREVTGLSREREAPPPDLVVRLRGETDSGARGSPRRSCAGSGRREAGCDCRAWIGGVLLEHILYTSRSLASPSLLNPFSSSSPAFLSRLLLSLSPRRRSHVNTTGGRRRPVHP